ncbi:response regulator transcription factor [Streptomyces pseudogriseolus]|uniref:DNA-binding protein n=1 Tax=Streptomyces pseudogriseolus TaxID=36817 RepID=A0ABQ2T6K1_STREZ|nr:LuxR C-terminal-related transcriptional regulator [Streptomyces rubiginosus]GGS54282.1 DNA-binding protein [Streptomyces rubiginosus]
MTAPLPTTPLTPAERRIAQHVVRGLSAREIADATQLSPNTTHTYLRAMRGKLRCPERCTLAVVAHRLIASGEATAPTPDTPAPALSEAQLVLLRAVTEYSRPLDIARAAKLAPADLRASLDQLLADAGAADTTQLVTRAHAWELLSSGRGETVPGGARR